MVSTKRTVFLGILTIVLIPTLVHAGGVKFSSGNPLDMDGNRINNLGLPVVRYDAASKEYVDLEIAAATDEVRTPISALPYTILVSGSYYVTRNLNGAGGGIEILASDVTVNLMGFTLDGGGVAEGPGIIYQYLENVTIINGSIRGFGSAGIFGWNSEHVRVIDVQVLENGWSATFPGIYLNSNNALVVRCSVGDGSGGGIHVGHASRVLDSIAFNNDGYGILAKNGSVLTNNIAYGSGEDGIQSGYGSTLTNNTANENEWFGFQTGDSCILRGNVARSNNQARSANYAGFYISRDSLVVNNAADDNYRAGFIVGGADNVLRNNHATESVAVGGVSDCFYFYSADNAAIRNTATGCTTEFAGSFPTTINRENDAW